jgi:hypothetical protein
MQRVAIFHFNWGRKLVPLFILALSILAGTLFLNPTHAHAATANTYKTETSDNMIKKVKALKYYSFLQPCIDEGRGFKTTISGDDIEGGPHRWMAGGASSVQLGQYIDSWGDKNGVSGCSGESDSEPGWITDMFSVYGISISDKKAALTSLGYTCTKNGGDYSCTNKDINSATSKNGILYQVLHSPYLNGVNPLTEAPDYKAVEYFLAMNSLSQVNMCKAKPGGSANLVTVSQVQVDGTVVTGDWGIQNDGGIKRDDPAGVPLSATTSYSTTCGDAAKLTVSDANDYIKWSSKGICATSFPSKASDQNFLTGCIAGRANKTNYAYCGTINFSSDTSTNNNMREACFLGQGLPVDDQGVSAGSLCYIKYKYTSSPQLTACIKGAVNRADVNYCNATYPPSDAITPGKPINDPNAAIRAVCLDGARLAVTNGASLDDTSGVLASTADNSDGGDTTSCGIEGIGWLVCPVISFMGDLLTNAFNGLADNFLATDTSLFDTSSGTYIAWSIFRNFANVAFVIVFLIIIFSQLTSIGVSNYGVKKLLPRIVIAAILVNLSYFICQVAVDLSNILGYSLKQVFDSIAVSASLPTSSDASGNGWGITAIIVGVIATATVAYFALSILIPILLGALIGVLMVVLMLIARKAIIILLIVLSPLAFVAFLLPNTESLFTKWRKVFVALLLLFPIISVVFGMSSLASQIVLHAGPGTGSLQILQIMAVGIATLPFFIVPSLLKSSLNGIGTVGAKLSSFASKTGGNLGKAGGKAFGNTALQRGRVERRQLRSNYRDQKYAKSVAKGGLRARFARGANIIGAQKYANTALERSALSASLDADNKDVKAATALLGTQTTAQTGDGTPGKQNGQQYAQTQLAAALKKGDSVATRAAYSNLVSLGAGGVEAARQTMTSPEGQRTLATNGTLSNALKQHIINNHPDMKTTDNRQMGWATNDPKATLNGNTHLDGLTDTQVASQTPDSIKDGNLSPDRAKRILETITIAPNLKQSQRDALVAKAGGAPSTPPPSGGTPPPTAPPASPPPTS